MHPAFGEELRKHYESMDDDQLLVVAAERNTLTPQAASLLTEELNRRRFSQEDLQDASARVNEVNAENEQIQEPVFTSAVPSFLLLAAFLAAFVASDLLGPYFFKSPPLLAVTQKAILFIFVLVYTGWQILSALNRRRRKPEENSRE